MTEFVANYKCAECDTTCVNIFDMNDGGGKLVVPLSMDDREHRQLERHDGPLSEARECPSRTVRLSSVEAW